MKRSTFSLMLLPLVAAGLAYAGVARAAEPAPAGKRSLIGTRCEADIAKFCAGIEAGGGKLAKCLHGHQEELLPECKGALDKGGWKLRHGPEGAGPKAAAATPTPAAPGAPVAGGPAPGTPGAAPAMPGEGGHNHGEEHRGGHGHEKADGPMKEMHEACMPDIEKFCKTVKAGRGRIATCLTQHTSELSPTCKPKAEEMAARMANMGAGGAPAPGMQGHGKHGMHGMMGPHHMGMGGAPGTAVPAPTPPAPAVPAPAAPAPAAAAPAKAMAPAPAPAAH